MTKYSLPCRSDFYLSKTKLRYKPAITDDLHPEELSDDTKLEPAYLRKEQLIF